MNLETKVKKIKKNAKGITLVALVVTIIVLLILAGVAISLTIGNNGIFTRAQDAAIKNENASVYEQLQFIIADYQMGDVENNTSTDILAKLKTDGYVNEDNTVNVDNLMGRSMNTGKGTITTGDVYVIEQRQKTSSSTTADTNSSMDYYVIYYDEDNTEVNLGIAFETTREQEPLYRLEPTEIMNSQNGVNVYFEFFVLLDKNNNQVEFGERIVIKQNGITYFDGDATVCITNNVLDISHIYSQIDNKWNKEKSIEIIAYKDGVPYTWSGFVSWYV